ncbi:ABC transporter ATP-binding protein [Halomonas sp. GXIMD04776]|uniref:ABC transporter ATP-binding protein n=1 Tax=Halomonas sp. GXIMD04776 TaxID=3415605 RepID=UPI003C98682D
MLRLTSITKTYPTPQGPLKVLDEVDLTLAAGESLALMGESGSGKSTLLHLAAGLDLPDDGSVHLGAQRLSALSETKRAALRRDQLGLVFQQFHLVPSLSVRDNLTLQARLAGREDDAWTEHLLTRLGLAEFAARYPEQLSGGQQQRLAIGRALAPKPRLLLADEPTGNLDEAAADQVLDLLQTLIDESGCALLMVTHSARVAAPMQRHLMLQRGRLMDMPQ